MSLLHNRVHKESFFFYYVRLHYTHKKLVTFYFFDEVREFQPQLVTKSVFTCRIQDLKELGELSPHWDNLRKEVMTRYGGVISSYQETLAEMDKTSGTTPSVLCVLLVVRFDVCDR